jgi:hypothetical protein
LSSTVDGEVFSFLCRCQPDAHSSRELGPASLESSMARLEYDLPVQLLCLWRDLDFPSFLLCLQSAPHLGTLLGDVPAMKPGIRNGLEE